jgi:omega-6 fatty acid desaturase (delta-12 desaturase)
LGDWIGRALGVLTLTPYDVWRKSHAVHHASSGNLDRRGVGDVPTMTVQEYRQCGWYGRLGYRVVRNPIFLFGLAPTYVFFLTNRLPLGQMRCGWRPWLSSQGTNIAIGTVLAGLFWFGGIDVVVYVFLPTTLFAASVGMWLFYVQHQFEDTSWEREHDWNVQSAAFEASSYYDLPRPLAWITADIGAHHVHHLASRIPSYRLREALNENKALTTCQRITLRDSLRCARLHLWDETSGQLVSFADANSITT